MFYRTNELMEIIKYINSIDIARHLQSINYQFSSLEAAFLIWQSHKISLEAKHNAWKELIHTMSDCIVPSRSDEKKRLHSCLEKYIDLQNRLLKQFMENSADYIYHYRFLLTHSDNEWREDKVYYPDYQSCLEAYNQEFVDSRFHCEIIRERTRGDRKDTMILHIYNGRVIMGIKAFDLTENDDEIDRFFEEFWIDIPTPFKKGDVLVSPYGPYGGTFCYDNCKNPFVLTYICNWENKRRFYDCTDMTANGYFMDKTLFAECIHNYLDLEYYRGQFQGRLRTLAALSNYMKSKIDICLLLNAYHIIQNEEYLKEVKLYQSYTKEGKQLAGINNSQIEDLSQLPQNPFFDDPKPKYTIIE